MQIVISLQLQSRAPAIYRYFGYGSNVLPTTMKVLRDIEPINFTAAILPRHELRFDGSKRNRIEPSAAFVTPSENNEVHGVLYTLTAEDFAKVGRTEGVPFAYRWKRCGVHTYVGDGRNAGNLAMKMSPPVEAFTLVSPNLGDVNIPPSPSYLSIIRRGSLEMKFDQEYQKFLDEIEEATNLIIPQGVSGILLSAAEIIRGTKRK